MKWILSVLLENFFIQSIFSSQVYDPKKCGHNFLEASGNVLQTHKILGGKDVPDGEHPWAVALTQDNMVYCSGTLISKKHVATAAHCFSRGQEENCEFLKKERIFQKWTVNYGSVCIDMDYTDETVVGNKCTSKNAMQTRKIKDIFLYESFYENKCMSHDMAILELDEPIDERIANYACLPKNFDATKISLTALGWGMTMKDPDPDTNGYRLTATHLQKLDVGTMLVKPYCTRKWEAKLREINKIYPPDSICVPEFERKDTCAGDSGGGLVGVFEGQYYLFGTLSFGSSCSYLIDMTKQKKKGYPKVQVFASVVDHLNEIDKIFV